MPFKEKKITKNISIRKFSDLINESELQWHIDLEDRLIKPLNKTNWLLQIDNNLPRQLNINESFFIQSKTWHRLIKGSGDLYLLIIKKE